MDIKQIIENSFYADSQEKTDFLTKKRLKNDCFWINVLGLVGLKATFPDSTKIRDYFKQDRQLRVNNIDDDNNDISLIIKILADSGNILPKNADRFTRFLVKLKQDAVKTIDEAEYRVMIEAFKIGRLQPSPAVRKMRDGFVDGSMTLRDVVMPLYRFAVKKKICTEFTDLARVKLSALNGTAITTAFDGTTTVDKSVTSDGKDNKDNSAGSAVPVASAPKKKITIEDFQPTDNFDSVADSWFLLSRIFRMSRSDIELFAKKHSLTDDKVKQCVSIAWPYFTGRIAITKDIEDKLGDFCKFIKVINPTDSRNFQKTYDEFYAYVKSDEFVRDYLMTNFSVNFANSFSLFCSLEDENGKKYVDTPYNPETESGIKNLRTSVYNTLSYYANYLTKGFTETITRYLIKNPDHHKFFSGFIARIIVDKSTPKMDKEEITKTIEYLNAVTGYPESHEYNYLKNVFDAGWVKNKEIRKILIKKGLFSKLGGVIDDSEKEFAAKLNNSDGITEDDFDKFMKTAINSYSKTIDMNKNINGKTSVDLFNLFQKNGIEKYLDIFGYTEFDRYVSDSLLSVLFGNGLIKKIVGTPLKGLFMMNDVWRKNFNMIKNKTLNGNDFRKFLSEYSLEDKKFLVENFFEQLFVEYNYNEIQYEDYMTIEKLAGGGLVPHKYLGELIRTKKLSDGYSTSRNIFRLLVLYDDMIKENFLDYFKSVSDSSDYDILNAFFDFVALAEKTDKFSGDSDYGIPFGEFEKMVAVSKFIGVRINNIFKLSLDKKMKIYIIDAFLKYKIFNEKIENINRNFLIELTREKFLKTEMKSQYDKLKKITIEKMQTFEIEDVLREIRYQTVDEDIFKEVIKYLFANKKKKKEFFNTILDCITHQPNKWTTYKANVLASINNLPDIKMKLETLKAVGAEISNIRANKRMLSETKLDEVIIEIVNDPKYGSEVNDLIELIAPGHRAGPLFDSIKDRLLLKTALDSMVSDSKAIIKPLKKLTADQFRNVLKYNNFKFSSLGRKKRGEDYYTYLTRMKQSQLSASLPELKVTPLKKTQEELEQKTVELSNTANGRHGDVSVEVLESYDVSLDFPEHAAWKKEHPQPTVIPAFHGTGSIAASMILRFGFAVVDRSDSSVVGRMLGDGIYFSNVIDKAAQYLGDAGYGRRHGTVGYLLEMEAYIGEHNKHYKKAGGNGDGIRSPEWCVFNARAQLKIVRAHKVKIVSRRYVKALRDKHPTFVKEDKYMEIEGLNKYMQMFCEEILEEKKFANEGLNAITYIFMDGDIPDLKTKKPISFEDWEKKYGSSKLVISPSQKGPSLTVFTKANVHGFVHVPFTDEFIEKDPEGLYSQFLALTK